ncbi:MAG TPA: glycosyltransferase family 39 protein, partial [Vicinamibacterales bacterium]|nr:glycosyltransferase family 39 protein [Vicinamibacterales bacterium]
FPGTYYAYAAALALFGESPTGVHLGLIVVNSLAGVAVFLLAWRWIGSFGATIAAVTFMLLSLDRGVLGTAAHATHFLLVPLLWGVVVLMRPATMRSHLIAGALFGLAVVMKQQAGVFLPFVLAYVAWTTRAVQGQPWSGVARACVAVACGAATPLVLLFLLLYSQGVFGRFWFWTFDYARAYASVVPLSLAWPALKLAWSPLTQHTAAFWYIGAAGLVALWCGGWPRPMRFLITGWWVAAFLAVCPGLYFREHYFVILLPVVAITLGVGAATLARLVSARFGAWAVGCAFAALVSLWVTNNWPYLTTMTPRELSRALYGTNPFVESPEVGVFLRTRTGPDDRIAVIGSEPQIYFYANRLSATGYIYTYALMEPQPFAPRMQREMIEEIEAAAPKFIVVVPMVTSWAPLPTSDRGILDWTERYTSRCYRRVGVVDIYSPESSTVLWDEAASTYRPRSGQIMFTFERRTDGPCQAS